MCEYCMQTRLTELASDHILEVSRLPGYLNWLVEQVSTYPQRLLKTGILENETVRRRNRHIHIEELAHFKVSHSDACELWSLETGRCGSNVDMPTV